MTGETEPPVLFFDSCLSYRHPEPFLTLIVLHVIDHDCGQYRSRSENRDVDIF